MVLKLKPPPQSQLEPPRTRMRSGSVALLALQKEPPPPPSCPQPRPETFIPPGGCRIMRASQGEGVDMSGIDVAALARSVAGAHN